MKRERAPFGVFLTAQLPTRPMERDAAAVGLWENEYTGRKHPRLQIITLAELFAGKRPDIPWVDTSARKKAKREDGAGRSGCCSFVGCPPPSRCGFATPSAPRM